MGCCQSSEDRQQQHDASTPPAAPLNTPNTHHPDSSLAAINQPSSPRRLSSTRPNQPLRPASPLPSSPSHIVQKPPPWTRAQLHAERQAFFESRVAGDPDVWEALAAVCELLRAGEVAQAQGIVDAVGVTCPSGRVAAGRGRDRVKGGVYDERGVLYELPGWVVADPEDVVEEEGEKDAGAAPTDGDDDDGGGTATPASSARPAGDEKGKARQDDIGELVRIRCRLSDRGTDVTVELGRQQRVGVLVRKLQEQVGSRRIRVMYLGKALEEGRALADTGWREGHVVNAMVFEGDEGMERVVARQRDRKR